MLNWSLSHRWRIIIGAVLLLILSLGFAGSGAIKSEFMGNMERDEFAVDVETDLGSTVEQTDRKIREIESLLNQKLPELKELFTTVGVGQGSREESNKGQILVKLTPQEDRKLSVFELQAETRKILSVIKDAKISTAEASTGSSGGFSTKQFQVLLTGSDLAQLEKANLKMLDALKNKKGIVDLDSSWRTGKPELHIGINRLKAADLGVNVYGIASVINTLIGGKHISNYEEGGEQYEVWVRLQQKDREKPQDIDKLEVRNLQGKMIDLGNVTTYKRETGPSQIQRYNRRRSIEITSNLDNMPLGEAVKIVQQTAKQTLAGTDVELTLGGEAEVMQETFQQLSFTLFLAIILIYMILASQFASFIHPITIMIALPLAIIGAIFGLFVTGKTFSMMSFIGIILLMGIVTKNSILLIDLTKQLRDNGMERRKAIMTAGPQRLRPILMTALSTIFGATPAALAIGRGAEMRSPMAVAIIGGLLTSTFLTLIVIPVVYTVFDDFAKLRLFRWLGGMVRTDSK
jgi:HAE1 family hydrophobic/amphiphilic exporter-1